VKKQKRRHRRLERAFYVLDLPPEAVLGTLSVKITSQSYIRIENHQGILQLTTEVMRFRLDKGELKLSGEKLMAEVMDGYSISVRGKIKTLEFLA